MARPVKFDRAKKQLFLDRFAGSCDFAASADHAGVSAWTAKRHLASDPVFAGGFADALKVAYMAVEAEAVRQVHEAQEAYRLSPTALDSPAAALSFDRALALMRFYRRADGSLGARTRPGPQSRWDFDESMATLDRKLDAFEREERRRRRMPPAPPDDGS
jgi:hypothetical protein